MLTWDFETEEEAKIKLEEIKDEWQDWFCPAINGPCISKCRAFNDAYFYLFAPSKKWRVYDRSCSNPMVTGEMIIYND